LAGEHLHPSLIDAKDIELNRVSRDLDFSEDEDILNKDQEAKRLADKNDF
jgi:hypothetical protein